MRTEQASPSTWATAIAVALVACATAACSSPGPSASSTTATSSAPTSSSVASSSTSAPSSTQTACTTGALGLAVAGSQGAAGTFELTFSVRNISTASCTMDGFPGTLLLDAAGAVLPTNEVRAGSYSFTNFSASPVSVSPGGTAYFNLGYSDVPTGGETSCEMATQLQVMPPGSSTHAVVTAALSVCNHGTLTVSPVFSSSSPQVRTTAPPHS